ncbi:MAG: DUF805 domain-containing protein [Pararhodobacter sp.]|nr:DUF805 domain-containing protein [Pararhodobacter sp.]
MDLFLSFDGRIRRGQWWLGAIILIVALIVLQFIILGIFGAGFFGGLLVFLLSLAALYPAIALATKRLADRSKPPMPRIALFFGPGLLASFMSAFNIGYRPMDMGQMGGMPMGQAGDVMVPGALAGIVGFIALVAGIWALVELGFLRGDAEANAYGPPPQ